MTLQEFGILLTHKSTLGDRCSPNVVFSTSVKVLYPDIVLTASSKVEKQEKEKNFRLLKEEEDSHHSPPSNLRVKLRRLVFAFIRCPSSRCSISVLTRNIFSITALKWDDVPLKYIELVKLGLQHWFELDFDDRALTRFVEYQMLNTWKDFRRDNDRHFKQFSDPKEARANPLMRLEQSRVNKAARAQQPYKHRSKSKSFLQQQHDLVEECGRLVDCVASRTSEFISQAAVDAHRVHNHSLGMRYARPYWVGDWAIQKILVGAQSLNPRRVLLPVLLLLMRCIRERDEEDDRGDKSSIERTVNTLGVRKSFSWRLQGDLLDVMEETSGKTFSNIASGKLISMHKGDVGRTTLSMWVARRHELCWGRVYFDIVPLARRKKLPRRWTTVLANGVSDIGITLADVLRYFG
ncbi:CACTA en-spm transposon protein [Cucumis melo var. makuwa]|uniref:CACTA en-spm transposon protein n=1 Tax=Cucumis melo var. makuwa TaxID=1194695 RepID=A0A5D3DHV8_CUCMM|nr:CACTA en-spm transposon protein [Cucumis melo var. makuwa]